jgi:transposase-like protein
MAAIDVGRLTEDEARAILEGIRWPNGIACPHCGGMDIIRIAGMAKRVRDGLLRCNDCHQQFTVMVGTIMEGSHIALRQWLEAFYAMSSSKKGISALQLQRNLGIHSYRSAWFLAHRIRAAMAKNSLMNDKLKGVVEVDETYVGGKPRKDGTIHKRGSGTKKTPVVAIVERGGKAISKPIDIVNHRNLSTAIREVVSRQSTIMSDESHNYCGIGRDFEGGHKSVKHTAGEYVNGDISTNTVESYFALLKRGVHGIFHHISKRHLSRYCDEFSFRWDFRKVNDGTRAEAAIRGADGKRLTYKRIVC